MKSGTKQYFERVLNEINNLKRTATKEEIGRLNLNTFNPSHTDYCIYGQMTGNCFSKRANELIRECCTTTISFKCVADKETVTKRPRTKKSTHSFLEHCIFIHRQYNNDILLYLKGEINEINFNIK